MAAVLVVVQVPAEVQVQEAAVEMAAQVNQTMTTMMKEILSPPQTPMKAMAPTKLWKAIQFGEFSSDLDTTQMIMKNLLGSIHGLQTGSRMI